MGCSRGSLIGDRRPAAVTEDGVVTARQREKSRGEDGGLRSFKPADVEAVRELIHSTIDSSYSDLYPPRAVAYFKGYHSAEAILARADEGRVVVVEDGGRIVATGAFLNGEICGVFVAPGHQGRGLGGLVMDELESLAAAHGSRSIRLNVSLPSRGFYEHRGYHLSEQYSGDMGEGQYLDYWEGEKEQVSDTFENVTIVKKANVYFDGKVTSRTVLFPDGTRKTLGLMMPGEYEFGTETREVMEVLAGEMRVLLPGREDWQTFGAGESFEVPAGSSFKLALDGVADYCCSYG